MIAWWKERQARKRYYRKREALRLLDAIEEYERWWKEHRPTECPICAQWTNESEDHPCRQI